MNRWYSLGQSAAKAALRYRVERGLGFDEPCDVFETVADENIDLQFVDIPSLEGMFLHEPEARRICVCALRPWGRQRFTAAHELGHYVLGHGTQVDTTIECREDAGFSDEEILADGFARFLLMPPRAVGRVVCSEQHSPEAIFHASCWLGVGYETLIRQMCSTLRLISGTDQDRLLRSKPRELCKKIARDQSFSCDAWPLDGYWRDRLLHLQVGDIAEGVIAKGSQVLSPTSPTAALATAAGTEVVQLAAGGTVTISVSRRSYVGFYDYRYLPEC